MKTKLNCALYLAAASLLASRVTLAVDMPMGTAFTYQGSLEKPAGTPFSGTCDFQIGLWDDAGTGALVPVTAPAINPAIVLNVPVSGGVFTANMDFGTGAINGTARWLAIEVRCPAGGGAYQALTPRVALVPAPHALGLPGLYTQQNATSPNLIGGYSGNTVAAGRVGVTIGGGGASGLPNTIGAANFSTIGGGANNYAGGEYSSVSGGVGNIATQSTSTVGGGSNNGATGDGATIGGGHSNANSGYATTVAGGQSNNASGSYATAGGGQANLVTDDYGTIGGGGNNQAGDDAGPTTDHVYATVGGGNSNQATGSWSTVAGGDTNMASGGDSTVGGGYFNVATEESATVSGGGANIAGNVCAGGPQSGFPCQSDSDCPSSTCPSLRAVYSTIGGGGGNIASASHSTVGGGGGNIASEHGSTVGGGGGNFASAAYSTVGGGIGNRATGLYSTVGGGLEQHRKWRFRHSPRRRKQRGRGRLQLCGRTSRLCQSPR